MRLSIIVTNYKTPDLLKLCLESIERAANEIDCEIFVIDSESQETTREVLDEFFPEGKIKLISFEKNEGYAKLVNAGLTRSQGDYILILNADLILFPDSLKR